MTTSQYTRAATLVALLGLAAACADITPPASRPALPPPSSTPPSGTPIATGGGFPALSRAGEIYWEAGAPYGDPASLQNHNGMLMSRFVLYNDGTFALQFMSGRVGFFDYKGSYVRADASVGFTWEGWSTAGPWGATGTVRGDTLHVAYNNIMMLSDFVDADYVRAAGTP